MDTQFYILLNLRTAKGPESFARFFIGNNRAEASNVFSKLKGTANINEENVLYLELMETREGLPFNLEMITCTLDQLADNCKIITKEMFKIFVL